MDVLDLFHILALKLFKNKIYWKIDNKKEIALPRSTEDKDIFTCSMVVVICNIGDLLNLQVYTYNKDLPVPW
jgi:hypothetical protein